MSDILEKVLSNHNEHTELYQNRLCVSQDHHLSVHTIFFCLEVYVLCVPDNNITIYSDRFSNKTTRARCLEIGSAQHNSWMTFHLKKKLTL